MDKITTNKWWLLEEKIMLTMTDEYMKNIYFEAFFLEGAKLSYSITKIALGYP